MYTHTRTTFARHPFIPARTTATEFLALYQRHVVGRPMFRTRDLERHVLAIDLRRFDLCILEEAFAGYRLSPSFATLERQLPEVLDELLVDFGDPTLWEIEVCQLPAPLTAAELS